ncbi:MAG: signal recognition particle-docking protein FtsY [Cyanobacteria bacterium HKST-UBA02]|nr:signal recognition particle-docking protein FtsY [Cyanobacteria bacterium HKST-UBA02]
MSEEGEKKGWWGSTVGKLKSALAKTKSAIQESVGSEELDQAPDQVADQAPDQAPDQAALSFAPDMVSAQSQPEPESEPQPQPQPQPQPEPQPQPAVELGSEPILEPVTIQLDEPAPDRQEHAPEHVREHIQEQAPVPAPEPKSVATIPARPEKHEPQRLIAIDEDYLENLEEKLIKADIGLENAETVVNHLKARVKGENWSPHQVMEFLKGEFASILKSAPSSRVEYKPGSVNIYLIVGVNGTGKTTSIGKLCWRFKKEGKRVLMAAGDTFRAAAESQLEIWSQRAGVDIVRLEDGSDPGAVVFKAIARAREENYDCLVIDTAGRLHNKTDLMNELRKIRSVIDKHGAGLPLESLLVLDASTGQNGLQQARVFTEVCALTGVVLTKLDGTAKGGIVFSIARDLKIPVKLIGLGEQIDDLRDFEPELFVEALF